MLVLFLVLVNIRDVQNNCLIIWYSCHGCHLTTRAFINHAHHALSGVDDTRLVVTVGLAFAPIIIFAVALVAGIVKVPVFVPVLICMYTSRNRINNYNVLFKGSLVVLFSLCDSVRVVAIALDFLLSTIIGSTCAGVLALFVVITSIYSYRRHNHIIATVKRPPYGFTRS